MRLISVAPSQGINALINVPMGHVERPRRCSAMRSSDELIIWTQVRPAGAG